MPRDYKREYLTYQGTSQQKKNRAKRNTARRRAIRKYGKTALKGKDVHHVGGIRSNKTRIISKSANRSKK